MNTELKFIISGQKLRRVDNIILAANSMNYIEAYFTFDASWEGYAKSAVFENKGISIKQILDENNSCYVPHEVLTKGWIKVSMCGVKEGSGTQADLSFRATSNCVDVEVHESGSLDADNAGVPTLTEIEQLELKAQAAADSATAAKEAADSVREDAENGEFDGAPGATPNIAIGEVTTLDVGSEATATLTGTAEAPILNLGIPRGEQGISGKSLYAVSSLDELHARCKENSTLNIPSSIESVCVAEQFGVPIWGIDSDGSWRLTEELYKMMAGFCYEIEFTRFASGVRVTAVTKTIALGGTVSEEQIESAVNKYLEENPISDTIVDDVLAALPTWEGGSY